MKEETLFERLARERNITVEEIRAIISARIEAGMNDPDSKKRAQWEGLKTTPCSECALNALAIDNPLEYATLYLEGRKTALIFFAECIA